MEQNSQHSKIKILEGQIRECYGRVVYSHKTHEKCSDILLSKHSNIKIWQIILSALATGGIISILFGSGNVGVVLSGLLSTALLIINSYTKDYDLGEIAQKHKQAANELWLIREQYLSLLTDLKIDAKDISLIQKERDQLLDKLGTVYEGAPSTLPKAYLKAQEALKKLEDMTFSDSEIDAFLPDELKRG
ncbi:SLATT domain-containing protein [Rhodohalobacter mucosus]|uniref:SMODS and SLOG-associating 2TM effector domain-containing protein n=1 Tax=Rhodohalobacter mucosus TaxID=2079485 RepID=A0A316TW01_9BACT|nr:SLATT domain-containing protein [Rhodohalobacter mucosus]PWN08021.1 hypothetical protein DDZ15_03135 [Rhodohalobacter mucosus]